ncbi:hypothetical protein CTAYLR_009181 [Chrysophaeum taylorii]|uniref:Uncharacterized protein n=1 Tax=Chrysophaeum taylorii TaxID=2483200 RepID=A0AAD7UJF2_9STRA|nr:hypothetical protein CTAYLR_009181 [Chrysophaeum taylorii]
MNLIDERLRLFFALVSEAGDLRIGSPPYGKEPPAPVAGAAGFCVGKLVGWSTGYSSDAVSVSAWDPALGAGSDEVWVPAWGSAKEKVSGAGWVSARVLARVAAWVPTWGNNSDQEG